MTTVINDITVVAPPVIDVAVEGTQGPSGILSLTAEAIDDAGGDPTARAAALAAQSKADAALPAAGLTATAITNAGGDTVARASAGAAATAASNAQGAANAAATAAAAAQDTADDAAGAAAAAQGTANSALASATTARTFLPGAMSAGVWRPVTGLPRLLLNGTGTVAIDARNRAGTVTTAVYSTTLASAVNQIDFPYFGDDAVEIRAAYTGSASAEIV